MARRNETPERFLQPNDPARLLRQSQQAATDDAFQQRFFAGQNQQDAYNRQRNASIEAAQREEYSKQRDFERQTEARREANRSGGSYSGYEEGLNVYRPVFKGNIYNPRVEYEAGLNPRVAMMREESRLRDESATRDLKRQLAQADRDRYNQQILEQQRQANERTMQGAQLAAQQRLAQIQQDTAILSGNTGESTWRWF
ncbi:hypothetical protein GNE08_26350 [Trichormus variabilis ARAD]|uniref:hypothetical protein n=1 Tax=Anabaena variabilis TaxID=264691 RepID=UPI00131FCA82|nr:hypothetical protein [Trichormus variabilis]MBC1217720.1 hypothetical protein [Trichormus variabilis ARAD]MBC1258989.1 hypothetical protein [Trichormus variabilis V5]MBC1324555.1 hypothetical protein [Trichormus variabilis 9RC]MBC1324613.1 hypothetical protein [Trichormus variabilis 9RC]QHD81600.1 hypothetical protein GSQ19_18315 [Trichormus variabilis 0441]